MRPITCCSLFAAFLVLVSCTGYPQPDQNTNWWFRSDKTNAGIKTIESKTYINDDYLTSSAVFTYNRNGTIASMEGKMQDDTYSYNSDGSLKKKVTSYKTFTETTEYEYNNAGRFVPVFWANEPSNVALGGLFPNLSKITITGSDIATPYVRVFTFDGDSMTMTTTGDGTYDPVVVEFHGAYPYQSHGFGPVTYQDNGMFDTVTEYRYFNGEVVGETTYSFVKGRNDKMLLEKIVYDSSDEPHTVTYTYNEYGDCIQEKTVYSKQDYFNKVLSYQYEYDSRGNWIKQTTIEDGREYQEYRTITYY